MAREPKGTEQTRLRVIDGGKSRLRRAFDECRANGINAADAPVITILSPDDEAYAAEVARLVGRG